MLKRFFNKKSKAPSGNPSHEQPMDTNTGGVESGAESLNADIRNQEPTKKSKKKSIKSHKAQFLKESRNNLLLSSIAAFVLFVFTLASIAYAVTGFLIPEIDRLEVVKADGERAQQQLPSIKKQLSSLKKQIQEAELAFGTSSDGLMSRRFFNSRINEFVAVLEVSGGKVNTFCIGSLKGGLVPCDIRPAPKPAPIEGKRRKKNEVVQPENVYTRAFKDKTLGGVFETVGQFVIEPEKNARGRKTSHVNKLQTQVGVDGVTIKVVVDSVAYLDARDVLFSELPNLLLVEEVIKSGKNNLITVQLELTYPYAGR